MNNSITPGLMKQMKHPITKRYCKNPTKQVGAATHAVGHNRTDNVLQQRGVTPKHGHGFEGGVEDIKNTPRPIGGYTPAEQEARINVERNKDFKLNTEGKNIGSNSGGRIAQHGSPLEQDRPPVSHTMVGDERIYPTISGPDSTAIDKHFKFLSAEPFDQKISIADDKWKKNKEVISWSDVSDKDVEEKKKNVIKDLNWLKNQYSLPAVKGVRDHFGYGPKK